MQDSFAKAPIFSPTPSPSPLIRLQDVCKAYREAGRLQAIFHEARLEVAAGQFVVLLGRSGSGKSTLLNLLSGIDLPDAGEILLAGTALNQLSEHRRTLFRRRHIGFVFQAFNLIPTLSVLENLLLPLELNRTLTPPNRNRACELLERVGLAGRADSYPDRLSGGEQQRLAIARALVHDPSLILADEPTGNLDLETGQQILKLLDTLVKEAGRTLVMATHSQEVIGLADRILAIRHHGLQELKPPS